MTSPPSQESSVTTAFAAPSPLPSSIPIPVPSSRQVVKLTFTHIPIAKDTVDDISPLGNQIVMPINTTDSYSASSSSSGICSTDSGTYSGSSGSASGSDGIDIDRKSVV